MIILKSFRNLSNYPSLTNLEPNPDRGIILQLQLTAMMYRLTYVFALVKALPLYLLMDRGTGRRLQTKERKGDGEERKE